MMLFAPIEWLSRIILIILVALSVWSVAIILERRKFYQELKKRGDSQKIKEAIRLKNKTAILDLCRTERSFFSELVEEIIILDSSAKIENAFLFYINEKKAPFEKGLAVLGTLGSTTPFIGLLGTILGIIVSFGKLSQGDGGTNEVMFSLAEALILTAVGLLVAIPAVIAFNYFSRRMKVVLSEASALKDLFIAFKD